MRPSGRKRQIETPTLPPDSIEQVRVFERTDALIMEELAESVAESSASFTLIVETVPCSFSGNSDSALASPAQPPTATSDAGEGKAGEIQLAGTHHIGIVIGRAIAECC